MVESVTVDTRPEPDEAGRQSTAGDTYSGADPMLATTRVMLFVASGLVFTVGIPLLFFTTDTAHRFAWTIKPPLTAAFLGGAYWASCILEFRSAQMRTWDKARVALPAVLLFTTLTFVATVSHFSKFHTHARGFIITTVTWGWIAVYTSVPVIMSAVLIAQLLKGPAAGRRLRPFPPGLRVIMAIEGIPLVCLGVALFAAPARVGKIWPWSLTPLTGQAIGAWLISLGVIALQIAWENDFERTKAAMPSYTALAVFELISTFRFFHTLSWSSASTWVYIVFLVAILATGGYGWMSTRSEKTGTAP